MVDSIQTKGRSLAYLAGISVQEVKGLRGKRAAALIEGGVQSVADLLLHVPRRYIDRSTQVALSEVPLDEEITVIGIVQSVGTRRPRRNMTIVEAKIFDGTSYLTAVWFNQAFRGRQLVKGCEVVLSGKVERFRGRLQMKAPAVDVLTGTTESLVTARVVPIHPAMGSASPGYLRRGIHNALGRARPIADPLPEELLDQFDLLDRDTALATIHFPQSMDEIPAARRRLVFDEFFRLEVALAMTKRRRIADSAGIAHTSSPRLVPRFVSGLPYDLTGAQQRTIEEIQRDLAAPHPMHRLLQGEVGSGKTVVAVAAVLTGVQGGYQTAIMAPTEVLAEQHFTNIASLIAEAGMHPDSDGPPSLFDEEAPDDVDRHQVRVALLTGSNAEVNFRERGETSRDELVEWVAAGEIDIVIGTHALIQEGVEFARLGIAVIDEQHRFGVHQRVQLKDKGKDADLDLLIMTATPIPRTLSMTLYGDLDVSVLDEIPPGRPPIETWTASTSGPDLERVYRVIRQEVAGGRQVFVVCPLVEDSDKVQAASAVAEHQRLSAIFSDLRVGLLHGQMRPKDKEGVMAGFRDRELDVLVATTVIEVGIDVPNATVMLIEDADRFGLSQLHQLRGRVGRGEHPSQCVLLADPTTEEGAARIAAMLSTNDGFRLAEEDLRIRGQGTIFGARQSGLADLKIADILRDAPDLISARRQAFALVDRDPRLDRHAAIGEEVRALLGDAVEWLFIS